MQKQPIFHNKEAWVYRTYDNWCKHYGAPETVFEQIRAHPEQKLERYLHHLGDIRGKRAVHLFGAGYLQAISFALLGSEVTVVDICGESVRYALEVARYAEVSIRYIVTDGLELPLVQWENHFDLLIMDHGALHYFYEIRTFAELCSKLLDKGGKLLLRDFHPFHKIKIKGMNLNMEGNYFEKQLLECSIENLNFIPDLAGNHIHKVHLRKWTMGEIITAFANAGMMIQFLEEHPMKQFSQFPGSFTLVAQKHHSP